MVTIIPLDQEVAKTMNDLRHGIPIMSKMNGDGKYNVAIKKDKAMLDFLMGHVMEGASDLAA